MSAENSIPLSDKTLALGAGEEPLAARLPRQLSDAEFELFCAAGYQREISTGEILFRKGDIGHSMLVVELGEIELQFDDDRLRKLTGPREFLGELALFVGDHVRGGTAIATAPSRVRIINYVAFDHLLSHKPVLVAQFMRRSLTYLVASEEQLIGSLKRRNENLINALHTLQQTQVLLSDANSLMRTDELTGLTNRRGLYQFLEGLNKLRKTDMRLALLLIDLDRFKRINDEFGHMVGDRALVLVAQQLHRTVFDGELCCRLGGDEFALLIQLGADAELETRAAQVVATVKAMPLDTRQRALPLSVSVGATLCVESADWSTWYSEADRALYAAKNQGGDCWRSSETLTPEVSATDNLQMVR